MSQETDNSLSGIRKNAPPRAVFHDLTTAHSSITSGIARSKGRGTSNNLSEILDEENSIMLQDLDPSRYTKEHLKNLPLPPLPAVFAEIRHGESSANPFIRQKDESSQSGKLDLRPRQECHVQQSSMFATIKNALVTISSPMIANDRSSAVSPSSWLKNNRDLKSRGKPQSSQYSTNGDNNGAPQNSPRHPHEEYNVSLGGSREGDSSAKYSGDLSSIFQSEFEEAPSRSLPPSSSPKNDSVGPISRPQSNYVLKQKGVISCAEAVRHEDFPTVLPGQEITVARQSNDVSSLPDGSTVGNIYKAYVSSDGGDEQSEFDLWPLNNGEQRYHNQHKPHCRSLLPSAHASYEPQPSALVIRKQRRAERLVTDPSGQHPKTELSNPPSIMVQRTIPCSSQGVGHFTSSGDTQNHLNITQPEHWTGLRPSMSHSIPRSNLRRSDRASVGLGDSSPPSLLTLDPNDPFQSRPIIISEHADGGSLNYVTVDRQPLERDVSNALRRVSAFSAYSDGSIASGVLRYADLDSELLSSDSVGNLRRQKLEETRVADSGNTDEKFRNGGGQFQTFYNQVAIAPKWISNHQNNAIRVPINHHKSFPHSPPHSPPTMEKSSLPNRVHATSQEPDDDFNDWETVGDSAAGLNLNGSGTPFGMLGGTIGQAGSSIANTSDDGTASSEIPEMGEYSSTERFIQHPGHIDYHGDYRVRDLKETRTPVFLPTFREHRVNGYLADSNRIRPPLTDRKTKSRPLDDSHANPFKSPPPERMPTQKARPSPTPRLLRAHKPSSVPKETLNTTESGVVKNNARSKSGLSPIKTSSKEDLNWMDDFRDPGPAIYNPGLVAQHLSPKSRPLSISSFEHVMILARGGSIPGYNPDGTRIHDIDASSNPEIDRNGQTNGPVEAHIHSTDREPRALRGPKTFVKGPPGAFFRDVLRSKPYAKSTSPTHDPERPSKTRARQGSLREYPTNTLRPLSLLPESRPFTPVGANGPNSKHAADGAYEWVYRSPLAPPKRFSSRGLYSDARLAEIEEAARNDHVEGQIHLSDSLPRTGNIGGSQKYLSQSPRMLAWSRDSPTTTDLCRRKNLSIAVLCLCNLFPPLLFFYALGKLDGIATWWSHGELTKFGKVQKRAAYIMMTCWALMTFLGLIAFLVYWFSGAHAH